MKHLFRSGVEPGHRPVHLPQLDVVGVDETAGRRDGLVVVGAIHVDHADGSAVLPNDICAIGRHLRSPAVANSAAAMPEREDELEDV
jgi:hypothetical protein